MKRKARILVGFVLVLLAAASRSLAGYHKGQKVEVEWHGTWYPAAVLEAKADSWLIHYDGYGSEWDEWVGPARIRPGGETPPARIAVASTSAGSSASAGHDIVIRKGGSLWAEVEAGGTIRVNGSIVGEISGDGTVRRSGSIVGEVESNGTIRVNGSIAGEIERSGTFRRGGSIVGEIEDGGTIRLNGSIWGSAESCCPTHAAKRKVAAVLVFFTDDFGF